jgi:hypothetical protein
MKRAVMISTVLGLGLAGAVAASAQTASPSNRDTTIQTGGPSGTSGAVGPNDKPDGSDKDGTTSTTPPAKPTHHHRTPRTTSSPPQATQR